MQEGRVILLAIMAKIAFHSRLIYHPLALQQPQPQQHLRLRQLRPQQ